MWPNPQFPAYLVLFNEEIRDRKPHFLCSASSTILLQLSKDFEEEKAFTDFSANAQNSWNQNHPNVWFKIELYYVSKSFFEILKKTVLLVFPWFIERVHDHQSCERNRACNTSKALDVKIAVRTCYVEN